MGWDRRLRLAGGAVFAVFVLAMLAGQVLGQPVLLGFVETGSMEPALSPGDGFVAVPSALAGEVQEGDVVVFEAEEIQGGGLTTHRVVEVRENGYVTKGDANPFVDQDDEEPIVTDAQVVAQVWQPGGSVLAIPGVGTVVTGTRAVLSTVQRQLASLFGTRALLGVQGLAYLLFALSLLAYALDVWLSDGSDRRRSRDRSRADGTSVRLLVAVFATALVLAATAAMVVPAGPQEYGVVSAESDSPGPRVIEQGTNETTVYPVVNGGLVPTISYLEPATEGVSVAPRAIRVGPRSATNATVTLSAPPETGYYRRFVTEHRYLAVLPRPAIDWLHGVHPWLPLVVIDGLLWGGFYLLGTTLAGTGRVRNRRREGAPGLFGRSR